MRLTHPVEAVHLLQPLLNQSNQHPLRKLLNTQNTGHTGIRMMHRMNKRALDRRTREGSGGLVTK